MAHNVQKSFDCDSPTDQVEEVSKLGGFSKVGDGSIEVIADNDIMPKIEKLFSDEDDDEDPETDDDTGENEDEE